MTSRLKAAGRLVALLAVLAGAGALAPGSAFATGAEFTVYTSIPDSVEAGGAVYITYTIRNTGDARSTGPIVMADTTSPGMTTPEFSIFESFYDSVTNPEIPEEQPREGTCSPSGQTFRCEVDESLPPGAQLRMRIMASVEPGASGTLRNTVVASAGNVAPVETVDELEVGPPGAFGFTRFGASLLDAGHGALTQAAAAPDDFTTRLRWRSFPAKLYGFYPLTVADAHMKNVTVHLPDGLLGNPTATPVRCTADQLAAHNEANGREYIPMCPVESQVGVVHLDLGGDTVLVPLYNVVPPAETASELGFSVVGVIVTLQAYVRPDDSGIDIVSRFTSTTVPLQEAWVTVWGNPAAHTHDRLRGICLGRMEGADGEVCPSTAPEKAFLRMPTSCSGEGIPFDGESDSYENPGVEAKASFAGPVMTGCERVPFNPNIKIVPTSTAANSPTGVAVHLSVPQTSNPKALAEADLKKAVVRLPEGMVLNPSSADGLQACTDAQLRVGLAGATECPEASKIGTVELHTPLLENVVNGFIWLRTQNSSDPASGEMFRIALELRDKRHGIDIKVPGHVAADPLTGRLTSTFDNNPQLPFEDIALHFKSGARAPLTTPQLCQSQTIEADLYPWSEPNVAAHRSMTFDLTSGPEGTPCVSMMPFNPGFNAGVSSVQAGGFTPFLTTFSRKDADQSMQRVSVTMPKGLLGSLRGLPLCPEAQANAGTCSQASEIGTVTAGAGDGPTPLYVIGGHVYMTGPYEGAPFGLSVVVPAKAGPFDLGTVVVRARVEVDVHSAQLTVTTDPLPQIVGGVPVNLRLVNVTIDRPNFVFNPTSCEPAEVSGSLAGGQGAAAHVANSFQVTNCAVLGFKPRFTASASGKTSRQNGASLNVHLSYPKGAFGKDANIAKVKVSLPKQLPSRLSTLQKACSDSTFAQNPAACPPASRVGTAMASTPSLEGQLVGPAYFVSHGGQKFPELIIVLQGDGVSVQLDGETFINKAGITSSTFRSIPDVPVESFQLKLPQGPNSALAANGDLCAKKLAMPTAFVAQNGMSIHQSTPITATGCSKHKHKHKRHKRGKRRRR